MLPWMDQMSWPNTRSPPTIVFKFKTLLWPAIIDDGSIRPFRIQNGVKLWLSGLLYASEQTVSTLVSFVEQNSFFV